MTDRRVAASFLVHDDAVYIPAALNSIDSVASPVAFVSRLPWIAGTGEWHAAAEVFRRAHAAIVEGEWASELEHRQAARLWLLEHGYTHALIPDGDEIIEPRLLESLIKIAEAGIADRVYVHWDTYWKSPECVIRPRERFTPCILIDLRVAEPVGLRNYERGRPPLISNLTIPNSQLAVI